MSLAEKFDEFAKEAGKTGQRLFGFEDLQRAFYSGAEAVLKESATPYTLEAHVRMANMEDEVNDFRSHK